MPRNRRLAVLIVVAIALLAFAGYVRTRYVVPILMYHRIDYNTENSKLSVSPESFTRQMEFLSRHGYRVIPLERLIDSIREGRRLSRKSIVLTFDDGYENNYTRAYPVLLRCGFPATIFVITDRIGEEGYLTWEQAGEMAENGISVGSHTLSHPQLNELDTGQARREISASRKIIEEKLGREISLFCYPYGGVNQEVKSIVQEAGYAGACITRPRQGFRQDEVYALPRVRISPTADNLFVFWIKTSGYYFWLKSL